jgi:DNA-binding beta-propeller fold protein YncE
MLVATGRATARIGVFLLLACSSTPDGKRIALPDGSPGIGFDDLRYSTRLHQLLVPGGRSGRLDLIEPGTLSVSSISGFAVTSAYSGGHDDGPTSVDEALGTLYVTDRTSGQLSAVDPDSAAILGGVPLGASPDYVRFVAATGELWVSEPSAARIEIFTLGPDRLPVSAGTFVQVDNGPESLVVDDSRGRVYTHRWQATSVAIDVHTQQIVGEWPNGCAASRGIALDESRGFLFAACSEGTATVLDVDHEGAILSTLARGSGFDVMGYSPSLGHLYLAGSSCACLVTLGVSDSGELHFLARDTAPRSTHCAVADDLGHAWVCDQDGGQLWRVDDTQSASP